MPIYEYECPECGLRFERHLPISKFDSVQACPECATDARKLMSAASFTFAHKPTGPVPQNTGVHAIDYGYDTVIGRSAEHGKKVAQDRQAYKRKVIRDNPGATGKDLRRTPDGDYVVMKPAERKASEAGRDLYHGTSAPKSSK